MILASVICSVPFAEAATNVYISRWQENKISVVNSAWNSVVGEILVPASPGAIVVSGDGSFMLAALSSGAGIALARIDLRSKAVTNTLSVPGFSGAIALHPSQAKAYISLLDSSSAQWAIGVVNLSSFTLTTTIPVSVPGLDGPANIHNINIAPSGMKLYVSWSVSYGVSVVDTVADTFAKTFFTPYLAYHDETAFSPDSSVAVMATRGFNCLYDGGFAKIDAVNDVSRLSVRLWHGTIAAKFDSTGSRAYVLETCAMRGIIPFRLADDVRESTIPTGLDGEPMGMVIADGKAFAGDSLGNLSVIELSSGSRLALFKISASNSGIGPSAITTGPVVVLVVQIDIKPHSFPNSINLGSGGTVPVAILSSASFDATTVNPATVTLASAAVKLKGQGTPMASKEDVNGDGLLDLVIHIETQALQLSAGDTEAVLTGATYSGALITGKDTIRIVP
jgi:hypothetical protein